MGHFLPSWDGSLLVPFSYREINSYPQINPVRSVPQRRVYIALISRDAWLGTKGAFWSNEVQKCSLMQYSNIAVRTGPALNKPVRLFYPKPHLTVAEASDRQRELTASVQTSESSQSGPPATSSLLHRPRGTVFQCPLQTSCYGWKWPNESRSLVTFKMILKRFQLPLVHNMNFSLHPTACSLTLHITPLHAWGPP